MPAAEDSGTAIGAAFYGLWQLGGYAEREQQRSDSCGRIYAVSEVQAAMQLFPEVIATQPCDTNTSVCDLLLQGHIVGWHEGGSELGPRALGQRSFFCDPRSATAKAFINNKVKNREEFRPFAPMILEEDVADWFEVGHGETASPFMLRVMRFRVERAHEVPAVVHIDGTGRVQTVSKSSSPKLHTLLNTWKALTGVPILLNTSFNVAGEPIVETPRDALLCLCATGVDWCNLGGTLVKKSSAPNLLSECRVVLNTLSYALVDLIGEPIGISDIPVDDDVPDVCVSAHSARASELEYGSSHLRLLVTTPWGDVVHGVPVAFIRIIECIDGQRTPSCIYQMLCGYTGASYFMDDAFTRYMARLSTLRRLGAIDFIAPSSTGDRKERPE